MYTDNKLQKQKKTSKMYFRYLQFMLLNLKRSLLLHIGIVMFVEEKGYNKRK